jgi:adenine-specific DNA-methyltransferase
MFANYSPFYDRAGIAIYHADCLAVLPFFPSESIDCVITDPPYLVNYRGRWDAKLQAIAGDGESSWVQPAFAEIYRVLKENAFCISFYGWPHADIFVGTWKSIGFRPVSHLAFIRRQWGLGRYSRSRHETAFLLAKGHPPLPKQAIADVIEWDGEPEKFHPNQKPLDSIYPLLKCFVPESGVVLDPFMGSGSTLRAAKDFGLRAVGIEIEENYCRIAVNRLAQDILFS